jgi:histidine triad (HIT) family protein
MNCIFCEIIKNNIPSYTIFEDEIVKVFLDINPDSNGHTLIIPKKHYLDISDIDTDVLNHIMTTAKKIKTLLEEKLNIDGLTLIQNNGDVQEIKHYHLHLKPYYKNKQGITDVKEIYNLITKES